MKAEVVGAKEGEQEQFLSSPELSSLFPPASMKMWWGTIFPRMQAYMLDVARTLAKQGFENCPAFVSTISRGHRWSWKVAWLRIGREAHHMTAFQVALHCNECSHPLARTFFLFFNMAASIGAISLVVVTLCMHVWHDRSHARSILFTPPRMAASCYAAMLALLILHPSCI